MPLLDVLKTPWVKEVALATTFLVSPFFLNGCGKQTLTSPEEPTSIVETIPQEGGVIETEGYTITFEQDTFLEPTDVTVTYTENQLEIPENTIQLEDQIHISTENPLEKPVQLTHGEEGTFARYNEEFEGWDKVQTTDAALTDQFSFWSFFDWFQNLGCDCDSPEENPDIDNQLDFFGNYVDHRCNEWATYKDFLNQYFIEGDGLTDQFMNANQDFIIDTTSGLIDFHNTLSNVTGFETGNYLDILDSSYSIYQNTQGIFSEIQSDLEGLPENYDILLLGLISPQGVMARQLANTSSGSITRLISEIHEEDSEHEHFPTRLPTVLEQLRGEQRLLEEIIEDTEIINFRSGDDNPYGNSSLTDQFGINPTQADIELAEKLREFAQNDLRYTVEAASYIQNIINPFEGRIAFVRIERDDEENVEWNVYSASLNNPENQINLTSDMPEASLEPDLSPNGEKIAFHNDGKIWIVDSNNPENKTFLTYGACASWSPDGEKIAYARGRYLKVIDLETHQIETIVGGDYIGSICWMPNNGGFVYSRDDDPASGSVEYNVYKTSRHGETTTQLTNTEGYDAMLDLSPDGQEIIFTTTRSGNCDIYKMDINGDNQEVFFSTPKKDRDPVYSPDGNHIIFSSMIYQETTIGDLFIIKKNGDDLTKILERGYAPKWSQ